MKPAGDCLIPQRFMPIIVHRFSQAKLVASMNGSDSGIPLASRDSEFTMREAPEPIGKPVKTADCRCRKGAQRSENHLIAKRFWDGSHETIPESFSSITIEERPNKRWPGERVTVGDPSFRRSREK